MHRTPRIGLATARHLPDLIPDDRELLEALRARGARASAAVWDAPLDWSAFDAVVVRSCWDSHLRRDEFVRWAKALESRGVMLRNPAALIEWNTDKRYLRDLAARGVPAVPTRWVERGIPVVPTLVSVLEAEGWNEAVVKPSISAGAHDTWRTTLASAPDEEARFTALVARTPGAVMVQPFVTEILGAGEWSLVFLGGRPSHAVRKRPKAGDFRVQSEHGGHTAAAVPPPALTRDASAVIDAAAEAAGVARADLHYARVDGVERDGRLLLMELECTEPQLFLDFDAGAAARAADVLLAMLAAHDRDDEAA